jgi:hypothetical protein
VRGLGSQAAEGCAQRESQSPTEGHAQGLDSPSAELAWSPLGLGADGELLCSILNTSCRNASDELTLTDEK